MINKDLLNLLGSSKKFIFAAVACMILGLLANAPITGSIVYAIYLLANNSNGYFVFVAPAVIALVAIVIRFAATCAAADFKDRVGREAKKELREKIFNKISELGMNVTHNTSMSALIQMSLEGVEQLDLYYSSYLPQFFYAMSAPLILFCITVWINWPVAVVLLLCVPLIPLSIVAVSNTQRKFLQSIGVNTPRWGTVFSIVFKD